MNHEEQRQFALDSSRILDSEDEEAIDNLTVIYSLIRLEELNDDSSDKEMLLKTRFRIRSISLIHEIILKLQFNIYKKMNNKAYQI